MPEEIEVRHGTLVLVKKHSYGWEFCPVISTFEGMIRGYVVMDERGNHQSIVENDDVYDYYLCDDIEEDRFYYLNDVIIKLMGERK